MKGEKPKEWWHTNDDVLGWMECVGEWSPVRGATTENIFLLFIQPRLRWEPENSQRKPSQAPGSMGMENWGTKPILGEHPTDNELIPAEKGADLSWTLVFSWINSTTGCSQSTPGILWGGSSHSKAHSEGKAQFRLCQDTKLSWIFQGWRLGWVWAQGRFQGWFKRCQGSNPEGQEGSVTSEHWNSEPSRSGLGGFSSKLEITKNPWIFLSCRSGLSRSCCHTPSPCLPHPLHFYRLGNLLLLIGNN